ncbi:MAG: T9SS type A sorting domain-containing protein, partial [Tritonibacter mobilis]|nr:T9SS type A sorting domain-containing protein [Tritonibacter mobilis]
PFNPTTRLDFEITRSGPVSLKVYDAAGRLVTTLVDESLSAGPHHVIWDGRDSSGRLAAAGIYLYRLETGNFSSTRRMTLIK